MKFIISLGFALCMPLLSFAQSAEKSIFGNITDAYFTYNFVTDFDLTQSNKIGLGIELYDNFDLTFLTSYNNSSNPYYFDLYNEDEQEISLTGESYGIAFSYRALPNNKLRPIVGVAYMSGFYKNNDTQAKELTDHTYFRFGVEYQVLDYLVLSANTNISVGNYSVSTFGEQEFQMNSSQLLSLGARLSFMELN